VRENFEVLDFLLNNYSRFWPKNLYEDWFRDKLFSN
jgi:hypothetical protein